MKPLQLARRFGLVSSALLFVALSQGRLHALQCGENFGPVNAAFRVNASSPYDQIWGRVARSPSHFTFTWSAGQDVFARRYSPTLVPLGGDFQVNTTLTVGIQDEPEVSYSVYGNSLIAWSDRNAYDGHLMGIFGRVFAPNGVALGPEFQINAVGAASQWRPLIAAAPAGGWVVAWSGDWDGNSYFRILDSTGAPLSGDIQVNDYTDNAQVDTAPAVNSAGTIFVAFVDFSSHGNVGTAFNLYGRTYTSAGVPNEAAEFVITSTTGDGNQRNPRVAADGLNRFIVVWETQIHDGSGYGIYARRFDAAGAPIGAEFQVNTITTGDQLNPAVVGEVDGGFVVMWNDSSSGSARTRGQRFDTDAQPLGAEFLVSQNPNTGVARPSIAAKWNGSDLVVAYSGPGDGSDVFARRFTTATGPVAYGTPVSHSYGCGVTLGSTGNPSLTDPNPFMIIGSGAINQSTGTMWFSQSSAFTPFIGETLLLAMPAFRTSPLLSGGNSVPPHDCSGAFSYDFNALIQGGTIPFLTAGTQISAQFIFRDAQDPNGSGMGLSNALRFTICP